MVHVHILFFFELFIGDDFPLIHQVVKHLESDHKKCEETLKENHARHGVVPAGCPMCRPIMICNLFLRQIYPSRWLQIRFEAIFESHFRKFENMRPLCKMLELNFGRPLHVGVQHYLSDFPATQISKKLEHNTSCFIFPRNP